MHTRTLIYGDGQEWSEAVWLARPKHSHQLVTPCQHMGWLRLVDSLQLQVSFAKEPYKRDDILQKRPMNLRSLLIVATSYVLKVITTIIM